ncbi:MAG: hypothetical protein EZS28_031789 [Streblomastix strix]|uniref:Uncharacterized protein n=1 Tax=Streblomastix strix TaxID=222440 RepID=A0A5J4USA4_9EUKA|nr:MAG: hypothetical protein EZS28_031789 [Streblomastix strix]
MDRPDLVGEIWGQLDYCRIEINKLTIALGGSTMGQLDYCRIEIISSGIRYSSFLPGIEMHLLYGRGVFCEGVNWTIVELKQWNIPGLQKRQRRVNWTIVELKFRIGNVELKCCKQTQRPYRPALGQLDYCRIEMYQVPFFSMELGQGQLDYCRIEIYAGVSALVQLKWYPGCCPIIRSLWVNWTIVELKSCKERGYGALIHGVNWTIVELKQIYVAPSLAGGFGVNWTIVELKQYYIRLCSQCHEGVNWTIVELKCAKALGFKIDVINGVNWTIVELKSYILQHFCKLLNWVNWTIVELKCGWCIRIWRGCSWVNWTIVELKFIGDGQKTIMRIGLIGLLQN